MFLTVAAVLGTVAGFSFHLRTVERQAQDLAVALSDVRSERETVRQARDDAETARDTAIALHQLTRETSETTIESIAYSPDGRWLAAGSRYEPVQLTRMGDGETFTLAADRRNRTLSFSADSQLPAVGGNISSSRSLAG